MIYTRQVLTNGYYGGPCNHYSMEVDEPNRVCLVCLARQVRSMAELITSLMPLIAPEDTEG